MMGVSRHATVHVQFLFPYSSNLTFSHDFLKIIFWVFFVCLFVFNVWINHKGEEFIFLKFCFNQQLKWI